MKKKLLTSIILATILLLIVVMGVMAGATLDKGTLETDPLAGEVNYTAWFTLFESVGFPPTPTPIHPPAEIMTEDSFNATAGADGGYTDTGWRIQVENMTGASTNNFVNMNFCGLGSQAGKNWFHYFNWDVLVETTDHGEVPLRETTNFTSPTMLPVEFVNGEYIIKYYGVPDTTYYIYRSQNPATLGSDRSNGRYLLVDSDLTDENGYGEYSDSSYNPEYPTWYVVMYFDDDPYGQHGCHSELAGPTNVRVMFEAEYKASEQAVILNWETASEMDVVGFNVLRSESEDGEKNKLNGEDLIAATPGGTGSSYSYVDSDVDFGHTYYYWLEIIGFNGRDEILGPRPAPVFYQLFLPLFN